MKYGMSTNGKQRFRCKACHKTFMNEYSYHACRASTNNKIVRYLKEGVGIRGTARLLEISVTTVIKRILSISAAITKPSTSFNKSYEVDEMRIFIKRKKRVYWVVYALEKGTKFVADFAVGKRTNKTLSKVIDTLLLSNAEKIYTDKLPNYGFIIPQAIHKTNPRSTNHIERMHLTIRTRLKRLSRRSICFSRSLHMLTACLKIYFWQN